MNHRLPSATVIIAARPDQAEIQAVAAAQQLDYPPELLEILVARGRQPSVQRNTALRAARGEVVYFLDDDSLVSPGNLLRAAPYFSDPQVQVVGGPNLCPPEAPPLEQIFALVLGSWIAFGPSRARYKSVGGLRESGEKELILCNLVARRETVIAQGGFNEALYPNEENALMDAIQQGGGRLLYDPALTVHRRPRATLRAFCKMLMTYGRGRAEQFRSHPTLGSALNFVPPMFCLFLAGLPWLGIVGLAGLGVYVLALAIQALALVPQGGIARSLAALPFLALSHVLYGLGFWRGLFTRFRRAQNRPPVKVVLETVPKTGTR